MTCASSIPLTDEQNAFVRSLVASGRYPDAGAVLRRSFELLRRETSAEDETTEAYRDILGRLAELQASSAEIGKLLDTVMALFEERCRSTSSDRGKGR